MQKIVLVGIGVLVIGAGVFFYTSSLNNMEPQTLKQGQQPKEQIFAAQVTKRKLSPEIVTVTQGDIVTMRVTSDESGEFHVSGYEIENDMETGKQLEFSFTADKAGRYNFELHPKSTENEDHDEEPAATKTTTEVESEEDIVIGAFVVNPR